MKFLIVKQIGFSEIKAVNCVSIYLRKIKILEDILVKVILKVLN
jgi:hypothetical protein